MRNARGVPGPPLDGCAGRAFIAGALPNRLDHLARWIANPQAVEPGTGMPDVGAGPEDARDMAACMFTLP